MMGQFRAQGPSVLLSHFPPLSTRCRSLSVTGAQASTASLAPVLPRQLHVPVQAKPLTSTLGLSSWDHLPWNAVSWMASHHHIWSLAISPAIPTPPHCTAHWIKWTLAALQRRPPLSWFLSFAGNVSSTQKLSSLPSLIPKPPHSAWLSQMKPCHKRSVLHSTVVWVNLPCSFLHLLSTGVDCWIFVLLNYNSVTSFHLTYK